MSRKIVQAARCCQMTSPKTGTGSGGDRCTEAVGAMIDCTYKLGPWARDGQHTPEQIMYQITELLNAGSNTSAPQDMGVWFPAWLKTNNYTSISLDNVHNPSFLTIQEVIDNGHVAIGGFNDYVNLRLWNGANPYTWNDPHGLGHVLLIVGYDTDVSPNRVIVHDPLRANPTGQPADYSWAGFQAAGFSDCTQVLGAQLPYSVNTKPTPPPPPAPDLAKELADLQAKVMATSAAYQQWLAAAPKLS